MNARQLFERLGAAPVEAPPKPTTKPPVERPGAPPRPGKHPNPYRRRLPNPGPLPKPKACEAKELFVTKNPPGRNSYSQRISRAQSMLAKERIKHHDREIQKTRSAPLVSEAKSLIQQLR